MQLAASMADALQEANSRLTRSGGGFYGRLAADGLDDIEIIVGRGIELSPHIEEAIVQRGGTRLGLVDFGDSTRQRVFKILTEGVSDGLGNPELARSIADRIPAGPWRTRAIRSRVIARTETRYAQNYATLKTCSDIPDVQKVIVLDARIGDTDEECEALDGTTVTLAEAERLMDAEHPQRDSRFRTDRNMRVCAIMGSCTSCEHLPARSAAWSFPSGEKRPGFAATDAPVSQIRGCSGREMGAACMAHARFREAMVRGSGKGCASSTTSASGATARSRQCESGGRRDAAP